MADTSAPQDTVASEREVDPFDYCHGQASVIRGFGGDRPPPHPDYCLHTHYLDVKPGNAYYRLRMTGVSATRGQLTVRVHATRVEGDAQAQMAASTKLEVGGLVDADIDHHVRFNALEGVQYALYAYTSEPTDLTAREIRVTLEELAGSVALTANRGRAVNSRLARAEYATSHRLVAPVAPSLRLPLSQPCMTDQLDGAAMAAQYPGVVAAEPDPLRQWEVVATLRALGLAGVDAAGAHGLLIDSATPALAYELAQHGIDLDIHEQPRLADPPAEHEDYGAEREGAYDFVVSSAMKHTAPTAEARLRTIGAGLRCLRGRGVGVFLMPFWSGVPQDVCPPEASGCLDRNAVQQIALRLIGQSYSVAQLAFPRPPEGAGEITSFLLIAHKLA